MPSAVSSPVGAALRPFQDVPRAHGSGGLNRTAEAADFRPSQELLGLCRVDRYTFRHGSPAVRKLCRNSRDMKRRLPAPLLVFASVGMLTGVLVSTLRSEERPNWPGAIFVELEQMTRLEPVRVFPHLEMSLVALEARRTLDAGRPWEAWRQLRDYVDDPDVAASHVMLTARAAAGWNAWDHVRDALQGRD